MGIDALLDLAAGTYGDRVAVGPADSGRTFADLGDLVPRAAAALQRAGGHHVAYLGAPSPSFTVALFAAAHLGRPAVPLNYRLPAADLESLLAELDDPLLLVEEMATTPRSARTLQTGDWLASAAAHPAHPPVTDGDPTAVVLFTSGTTAAPKGVLLRHDQLLAYVLRSVEFAAAGPGEAALVTVPPYHVAGVASAITNLYAGRRVVHLPTFDAEEWLALARTERITTAMVVPTMLARLVEHLDGRAMTSAGLPALRTLAYGGASIAPRVLDRALQLFPDVGFTNAYGLTETSSTIAVLDADEHRRAAASDVPGVRARLGSVGHPVPGIEVAIRDDAGRGLPPGQAGDLFVRGPQVSGTYLHAGTTLDGDGWFATRDRARLDGDGFLFIEGRVDDTIIRGAENIAPAEIEAVFREHPDVVDVATVGLPDEQWGQRIVAAVVLRAGATAREADLRKWAGDRLRSSRTPEVITTVAELPYSPTGKLLRRSVAAQLGRSAREPA